jgi:hypothetical protein
MKANELRIGNYVLDTDDDSLMVVSRLESTEYTQWNSGDFYNITCKCPNDNYYEGLFKPIPLTEEWLLKFGFKKNDEGRYDKRMELILENKVYHFKQGWTNVELKYVHQLQNLYFAITGEELICQL